jgi:hypothetical protein
LALSGGWNPSLHLACHMNGRPRWDAQIAAFVPVANMVPGMAVIGGAAGQFSTHGALHSAAEATATALADLGLRTPAPDLPQASDAPYTIAPLWQVPGKRPGMAGFPNDVTTKDVALAAR